MVPWLAGSSLSLAMKIVDSRFDPLPLACKNHRQSDLYAAHRVCRRFSAYEEIHGSDQSQLSTVNCESTFPKRVSHVFVSKAPLGSFTVTRLTQLIRSRPYKRHQVPKIGSRRQQVKRKRHQISIYVNRGS